MRQAQTTSTGFFSSQQKTTCLSGQVKQTSIYYNSCDFAEEVTLQLFLKQTSERICFKHGTCVVFSSVTVLLVSHTVILG